MPRFVSPDAARCLLLVVLLAALPSLACDSGRSATRARAAAGATEAEGLSMLDVMIQIQIATDSIEPDLRNAEALERVAESAQILVDWSTDPVFEQFTGDVRFFSDPESFLALRDRMEAASRDMLRAAEEQDLELLRDGFVRHKQSCIACHKRYSPSY